MKGLLFLLVCMLTSGMMVASESTVNFPVVDRDGRELIPVFESPYFIMYQNPRDVLYYFTVKQAPQPAPKNLWQRICCCKRKKHKQ